MFEDRPIQKALSILRVWLAMFTLVMVWNSIFSGEYLLHEWLRPLPFLGLAVMSVIWAVNVWSPVVSVVASSAITVASVLRVFEIAFFAESLPTGAKLTAMSLWFSVSGTSFLLGMLNILMISRKRAEEAVWKSSQL